MKPADSYIGDNLKTGISNGYVIEDIAFVNTSEFTKTAQYYMKHGCYTHAPKGSRDWKDFWDREEDRRKNGMTMPGKLVNGKLQEVHITGEHYGFLNYGRISKLNPEALLTDVKKMTINKLQSLTKIDGFPDFMDGQYHWFKAKEFGKQNGLHIAVAKARRKGFSYMEGFDCANTVNLYPAITVLLGAYLKNFLTQGNAIAVMAKSYLDWFETETNFKRCYLSTDLENMELGYKPQGLEVRKGYRSKIICVSFKDRPDAAVGKDAIKIKLEELGTFPNLFEVLDVTEPLCRTGAFTTGQIIAFGTAGAKSKETNWEQFEKLFYDGRRGWMRFENVWDDNAELTTCGFYYPYYLSLQGKNAAGVPAIDEHGNSNIEVAKEIALEERANIKDTAKTYDEYLGHCSQMSFSPNESFSRSSENIFSSPELTEHIHRVENDPSLGFYRDGMYAATESGIRFITNEEIKIKGGITHPYIVNVPFKQGDDVTGCVREYFSPVKINGAVPKNLYRAWLDPVGVDKDKKQITTKNSLNALYVYMNANNISDSRGDILVASYVGRTSLMEEYNTQVELILEAYNAQLFFENDRGDIISHFKAKKKTHRLATEPDVLWDKELQSKTGRGWGMSMGTNNGARKLKAIVLYKEFLYTQRGTTNDGSPIYNLHTIYDIGLLKETAKWRLDGNFDRVSAMLVGMFDRRETTISELKINPYSGEKRDNIFTRKRFTNSGFVGHR